MSQSLFSLDHRLAEIRQVGDDLRAARYADQVRNAGRTSTATSISRSFHGLLASLTSGRPSGLAAH